MAKVEIEICDGKEVTISERKKYRHNIKFVALGIMMIDDKNKEIEISRIMQELGFNANWLLWCLIEKRNYNTNVSMFSANELGNDLKKRLVRGHKELSEKNLVIRIKKATYMLNPDVVIPNFNNYAECKNTWLELVQERGNNNDK